MSLTLTACVSESSYVGSDRQVGERSLDNSEAARTRISLGLNYLRRGDTTQAKYNLERAKAFAPDLPEVYNALAFYYQSVGEHIQAEDAYKKALDKDSNNADAYNNYGAFLCQIGKYQEAEELLLKAISRPGYIRVAESYENLALCQLDQQGYSKAKTFLESSVSHNGTRISSLINLAAVNYAMGDNVGAKASLQRIQRLGRVSARSTLLNYLVAEKQGDVSTMKHAEQLLLTLYIDTPEARLLLQQRLLESEFEQLREQYKLSLMANIVLPDNAAVAVAPTDPVANPRLRVVRRKTSESAADDAEQNLTSAQKKINSPASSSGTAMPSPQTEQASTAARSVSSQAIAGVLATSQPTADDEAALEALSAQQRADQQAAETARQLATKQAAEQQAKADELAARQLAEQQRAEQLAAEQLATDKLAAEQRETDNQAAGDIAANQPAEQPAEQQPQPPAPEQLTADQGQQQTTGQAEQDSASQLVLAATPPVTLPVETVLAEPAAATVAASAGSTASAADIAAAEVEAEKLEAESTAVTEVSPAEPAAEFHIVQEGESLYAISVAHNIRLARLMEWNQLTPESVIKTGQRVWLAEVDDEQLQQQQTVARLAEFSEPVDASEPYHQVAAGETMFGISYRYNIRLERFMTWNNLTEQSKLQVGQQVLVIDPANIEP
ncbi:MAG: type IV pilus biogenesis/stability protein PilW [Rheinheimera sp.]|nr:type IV pilus biogenesis/stability protein PilW [Rheinheimera sp.]MBM34331.1 type IV pilus biogenesis/stability protein PilW [Rheinheimera sp.]HAW93458.1 type IV pilus biogenesis/stability protein PilW [Candidatus Azambacteria bacterium]